MRKTTLIFITLLVFSLIARSTTLTVKLKGVYDSDITLSAWVGQYFSEEIGHKPGVTTSAQFIIPQEFIPGQFLIEFNYRKAPSEKKSSSQFLVYLNQYDLEYTLNPAFTQYDSITHTSDPENELFYRFVKESSEKKSPIGVVEKLLMNYDRKEGKFYQSAEREYKARIDEYNAWLNGLIHENGTLFASRHLNLDLIPFTDWSLPEDGAFSYQIHHYFDHVNWSDSLLIRSSSLSLFMNNYIQLFARKAETKELADSLFTQAGRIACDAASKGHPLVYGWMVDFFYMGYEQLGIEKGMKMLEMHLKNPNCLTQSSADILRRLEGMGRLIKGSKAPDFTLPTSTGSEFTLYESVPPVPYVLVLFWSADCDHCLQMVDELTRWQYSSEKASQVAVVAISVDYTPEELAKWNEAVPLLPNWVHLHAVEGMGSKVAYDYVVLSTPAIFLLNSNDYTIAAMPLNVADLDKAVK